MEMTQACILLIDDDDLLRELLAIHLEIEGYEVLTASDGRIGLDVLRGRRVDLIVLDLMMPVMDGLRFMTELGAEHVSQAPIIVLSATRNGAREQAMLDAGATVIVRKPVEPAEFLNHVSIALAGKR